MAGGLFKDSPFRFNIKCVIFSALLMIAFALAPIKSYWVLASIPILTALGTFGYHSLYKCKKEMKWGWMIGAILLMMAYWFSPERTRKEWVMYFFIFVYGYVAMAYYDYVYECEEPLEEGLISLSSVFKPERV